jgi:Glucodextranase, domain N
MKTKTLVRWTQALVACAAVCIGQLSLQAQGMAPGDPGGTTGWLPANKTGFGTSYTTASNVWFTLQGGRLSEVYYPDLSTPSVRNLDFVVTDGHSFAVQAQDGATSTRLVGAIKGRGRHSVGGVETKAIRKV